VNILFISVLPLDIDFVHSSTPAAAENLGAQEPGATNGAQMHSLLFAEPQCGFHEPIGT
jgi:hypothetical protein